MRPSRRASLQSGQWSLIGTLVAIAIIIILAALYIPRIAARHSAPGAPATPKERAYGAACGAYTSQFNEATTMYKSDHDGASPTSLDDLKKYGVTDEMIHAPGCSFQIDPATGTVTETGGGRAL